MTNVVDSNVWVIMDHPEERACALACVEWGSSFSSGNEKLAVDTSWRIITEYRRAIKKGGLAERYLNEFLSHPWARIEFKVIEFDHDGYALLPDPHLVSDPADRKFAAVAIQYAPPAPIINATDTDWEKDREKLSAVGISVHELCHEYILQRLGR